MAVILSDDTLPNRTVIVSPVSSWVKKDEGGEIVVDENGDPVHKQLHEFHLGLSASDYPNILQFDSYIKLDQIFTITRDVIEGTIVGRITNNDMFQVDLRLMIVLQMFETLKKIVEYNVNRVTQKQES